MHILLGIGVIRGQNAGRSAAEPAISRPSLIGGSHHRNGADESAAGTAIIPDLEKELVYRGTELDRGR
jgi:hypothetical protein